MTTRTEFLARIRASLERSGSSSSVPGESPRSDPALLRLTSSTDDLVNQFAVRAAATGMFVHRCGHDALEQTVRVILEGPSACRVVLDMLDSVFAPSVEAALRLAGAQVHRPVGGASLDLQFDANFGVSGVVAAIAETGTLVVASDSKRSRGTFLIPPVHIAIVGQSQIMPDLLDLWPTIGPTPPTAMTLITGPSKTADIEGILVTGVHGPRAVHVVLVDDQAA